MRGETVAEDQGRKASPRRPVSVSLFRRSKRRDLTNVPGRAEVLALSSVLLTYPDEEFYENLASLETLLANLPESDAAKHLRAFWRTFVAQEPLEARKDYVETFDMRRRSSLFLTYYLHGDTRQRGMALLALKQRYRASGFTPEESELPDYLPMVLEFAARAGTGTGEGVLRMHRGGIELIRKGLEDRRSHYREILDAVTVVLGPITERQRAEVNELARNGPPTDTAGIDAIPPYGSSWTGTPGLPFGPPEFTHAPEGL